MKHKWRVSYGVIGNGPPNLGIGETMPEAFAKAKRSNIQSVEPALMATVDEYFSEARKQISRKSTFSVTHEKVVYLKIERELPC